MMMITISHILTMKIIIMVIQVLITKIIMGIMISQVLITKIVMKKMIKETETESDCSKTSEISSYISEENEELTDDDEEFEKSEMTKISDGTVIDAPNSTMSQTHP